MGISSPSHGMVSWAAECRTGWVDLVSLLSPKSWALPLLMALQCTRLTDEGYSVPGLLGSGLTHSQGSGLLDWGEGRYSGSGPGVGGACGQNTGVVSVFPRRLLVGRGKRDWSQRVRVKAKAMWLSSVRIPLGFCNYQLLIEHNKEHQEFSH